ncbi:MAG: hypothetical protein EHM42_03420 [Planctomycetaceae bacterium]|nr:MAG: hypothetical protein EHM42_03420 [Planctomycetaceae bacterium]
MLLLAVHKAETTGRVFKLATRRMDTARHVVAKCRAEAKLNGTARHLPRSFATCWARKHPALARQRLMRHSSLQATMTFDATGEIGLEDPLWAGFGDKSGDKPLPTHSAQLQKSLEK